MRARASGRDAAEGPTSPSGDNIQGCLENQLSGGWKQLATAMIT